MTRERRNSYGFPTGSTLEPAFWWFSGVLFGVVLVVAKVLGGAIRK